MKLKILVVTPSFNQKGGVVEFNKLLVKYGKSDFSVFELSSGLKRSTPGKVLAMLSDFIRFTTRLIFTPVDIVQINPSLGKNAVFRDGNLIRIARVFNKKIFIQWHGWNPDNEHLLEGKGRIFFQKTFFKADQIRVLSNHVLIKFTELGFTNKITLGNTFIDDELLEGSSGLNRKDEVFHILFLSTISKNKGIYLAVEALQILQSKGVKCELIIAGIGEELENIKDYVQRNELKNVEFAGHVEGQAKQNVFRKSHVYLFPSYYEGMPTSVLEAMGFGLPVVCSNAGALAEFFEDGIMGFRIDDMNAQLFADALLKLSSDQERSQIIGVFNSKYARNRFLASESVAAIEGEYKLLLGNE